MLHSMQRNGEILYLSFSMVLFLLVKRKLRVFLLMHAMTPTPTRNRKATRIPRIKPALSAQ